MFRPVTYADSNGTNTGPTAHHEISRVQRWTPLRYATGAVRRVQEWRMLFLQPGSYRRPITQARALLLPANHGSQLTKNESSIRVDRLCRDSSSRAEAAAATAKAAGVVRYAGGGGTQAGERQQAISPKRANNMPTESRNLENGRCGRSTSQMSALSAKAHVSTRTCLAPQGDCREIKHAAEGNG